MIPILMQDETTVGFLKEAMSCVVTEERNGVFELTLTYPVTGALFDKLQIDRFVKAKPNDTADLQIFRIYEVTKPMNGVVTVNAEHVSYALSNFPVDEINITGTATQAINAVLFDVTYDLDYFDKVNPFMVATTDMEAVKAFSFKIGSARAALGGNISFGLAAANNLIFSGYLGVTDSECTVYVDLNAGDIFSNGVQVQSTEDIKQNIEESGSALDAIRGSKIYTYNLVSNRIVPEVTQINVPAPDPDEGVVVAQSEEETLNGASAPEISDHVSTGFVIGRETPDAVLSEDGAHIDLYAMAALNWRATQELLERIEQLEEKQ